jgi:hypothetical protein
VNGLKEAVAVDPWGPDEDYGLTLWSDQDQEDTPKKLEEMRESAPESAPPEATALLKVVYPLVCSLLGPKEPSAIQAFSKHLKKASKRQNALLKLSLPTLIIDQLLNRHSGGAL